MPLEIREVGLVTEPVICPVCRAVALAPEPPDPLAEQWNPIPGCNHVWGLWHDLGIAYLSTEARAQLAASGVLVVDYPDGGVELELGEASNSGDDRGVTGILTECVHGVGAVILAVYSGPPSFDGTYVGVAQELGLSATP